MKKLINHPEDVVRESLEGFSLAYADLVKVHFDPTFVYRADAPVSGKVALISGGGSGHEPMHTGYVGRGMLSAACPGAIFTSPTPDQMLEAARTVDGGQGVLFIVKNYSGDVMNFSMAADLARSEGLRALNILIDDDVAVKNSLYTQGRRGVGATVLAEKICGAAAERGYDLPRLADLCRRVNLNARSMGVALTSCTVPAVGHPTFDLAEDQIELGIGIHGEPGQRRAQLKPADEIAEFLTLSIIEDGPYQRTVSEWNEEKEEWQDLALESPPLKYGDSVLAFVNSMGGTPAIELPILYRKLAQVCEKKGLRIARTLMGPYITSLEMAGCSITLLKLDEELASLWDDPVKTPGLRWGI
ncbi:MAG: dihydroxyacetone kinase subunit DhaK [Chloroflexi bacterium]|nr:dihydroxyacetone kinase subunit DhaK [Chloroflexota bacterium]